MVETLQQVSKRIENTQDDYLDLFRIQDGEPQNGSGEIYMMNNTEYRVTKEVKLNPNFDENVREFLQPVIDEIMSK